jgi:hypothetical protein
VKFYDTEYEGVIVELDGHEFYRCKFEGCALVYRGGTLPLFEDLEFYGSTFIMADAALRAMEFLAMFGGSAFGDRMIDEFVALLKTGRIPGATDVHHAEKPDASRLN